MNKREARQQALANTRTVGELRDLIRSASKRGGTSRVNSIFSIERVCEVYLGALERHHESDVLPGTRQDGRGREKATGYALTITNILRDCA